MILNVIKGGDRLRDSSRFKSDKCLNRSVSESVNLFRIDQYGYGADDWLHDGMVVPHGRRSVRRFHRRMPISETYIFIKLTIVRKLTYLTAQSAMGVIYLRVNEPAIITRGIATQFTHIMPMRKVLQAGSYM
jgi:hypothetical protein